MSTDRRQLDYGVVANRVKLFMAQGKTSVAEFFSFVPLVCFTCRRERTPEQITIGHDWVFRCIDRDDCVAHWNGQSAQQPSPSTEAATVATKKHKYRVKKKS